MRIGLVIPLWAFSISAWAQGVPAFDVFTQAKGLSSNSIEHVFEDSRGFLWISTANGLNRFDGYEFKQFHYSQTDSLTLPTGRVKGVSEDSLGRIWVACWGGVARIDPISQVVQRINVDVGDPGVKVRRVHCDKKGRVWLAMEVGLFVFDLDANQIGAWPRGALPNDITVDVYEDSKGRIWAENKAGPCLFDETTKKFIHFPELDPPYLKGNGWIGSTIGMEENTDGTFYHGSWANGLKHFDPITRKTKTWLYLPQFAGHGGFNVITSVKWFNGKLWVASHDRGLGTFDPATQTFSFLRDQNLSELVLPTGLVSHLCVAGNILWVATNNGLYRMDRRKQLFNVNKLAGVRHGSCMDGINRIIQHKKNPDSLVLATSTCGVFSYSLSTQNLRSVCGPLLCPNGKLDHYEYNSIFTDSKGTLWIATNKGLIKSEKGKQQIFKPGGAHAKGGAINFFTDVLEDAQGHVWAGTFGGIVRFDHGSDQFELFELHKIAPHLSGKITDRVVDLALAPNGDVWAVRDDWREEYRVGLTVFRAQTNKFESYATGEGPLVNYPFYRTSGTAIEIDEKGRIYCATQRGLAIISSSTLALDRVFTTASGLNSDLCQHIAKDSFGRVWVASNSGISVIDPADLSIRNYSTNDGIAPFTITSLSAGLNGSLFVGHANEWISVFNPALSNWHPTPDRITLTRAETSRGPMRPTAELSVPHDFGFLRMAFSPLNFLPISDNRFHIVIEGPNGVSDYVSSSNELTLSGIAPGHYKIGIRPMHDFAKSDQLPSFFHLIIVPAYYQTLWFKIVVILLILMIISMLVWFRFRTLAKQQARELQLNWKIASTEMTALRSQMTPHFMFNALNTVNRFIWAEQKEQASDHLVKFARLTRKVLESSREQWVPLHDDLDTLRDYLEIEKVNLEHGLDFDIELAESVDPENVMVPPMMLQPFVENALKHGLKNLAKRGQIRISIAIEGQELKCTIEDNGVGRTSTLAQVRKDHNSLGTKITAERIEVINALKKTNARFSYIDKTDAHGLPLGTLVVLYLPLIMDL